MSGTPDGSPPASPRSGGIELRRAFVTGGSGFVGGALVQHLVESGIVVRGLARSDAAARAIRQRGAEPVRGDLETLSSLASDLGSCDVVFHVAGVNSMCPRDPAAMYRANVNGARNAVRLAAEVGARRVVLTSSAAAIGEPHGIVADERTAHSGRFLSHYARSKYLGEQAFFDEAVRADIHAVAVNPSSVQGPGRSDGSALFLRYALTVHRPVMIDTWLSIVDVDDVARAHVLAADGGSDGARYLISGPSIGVREAIELVEAACDRIIAPVVLPRWMAGAAYPVAAAAGLVAGERPICVEALRTLRHGHRFDTSRSVHDLGLTYTPLRETLARAAQWLAAEGFVEL